MVKNNLPKIVIVGRPNVGKSSLFNRIAGSRKAIVESASGTTRDRLYADIKHKGKLFTIVDTGGFDKVKRDEIAGLVLKQVDTAIDEADIIFFVTDGAAGVLPQDIELASKLRKTSKKIYLVVNKIDSKPQAGKAAEFFELGLGEPYAVSAANGTGIDKLIDEMVKDVETPAVAAGAVKDAERIKVAIVGRPNVGKSSYLNAILNEERAIVHPAAGTTRDASDTCFEFNGTGYILIDTAGLRHNAKINQSADFYGSVRSREAIKRSDIAVVIIDGFDGLREDDTRVIDFCLEEGKALMVVVNKWDLFDNVDMAKYRQMLVQKMNIVRNYPVIFTSCKTKKNIIQSFSLIKLLYEKSRTMIPPAGLTPILEMLNNEPQIRNRRIKFKYLVQNGVLPPAFAIGVKSRNFVNANLKAFTENFLRGALDFEGVPLRISFESKNLLAFRHN